MERLQRKLFDIKRNQIRMMQERGYQLPPNESFSMDLETFLKSFSGPKPNYTILNNLYIPKPNISIKREPVYLFYLIRVDAKEKDRAIVDSVVAMIDRWYNNGKPNAEGQPSMNNFIIITSETVMLGRKLFDLLPSHDIRVSLLDWNNFRYDLTNHVRIPKHRLLSGSEREQFLSEGRFKAIQLPAMMMKDQVAIYYAVRPGDIFLIQRRNQVGKLLGNNFPYYRIVTNPFMLDGGGEGQDEGVDDFDIEQLDEFNLIQPGEQLINE